MLSLDEDSIPDEVDIGGEDFAVNYLSHAGMPSVELVVTQCPNRSMRKRLDRMTRKSIRKAGTLSCSSTDMQVEPPSQHHHQSSTDYPDNQEPDDHATITSVSVNVNETLDMLKKLMPGKRLSDDQMMELAAVLSKNHEAFASSSQDYGKVSGKYKMEHVIETEEAKPVLQKPYRHSRFEEDFLKNLVAELKTAGLIRPSSSPWMSPVVLVKKKDGTLRMCIDFRRLNKVTKRDPYQLPRVDSLTDRMQGCQYFTSIDVLSAFWNVPMAEQDIQKTGFSTAFGNFEWTRMPFGLVNASSSFQRLMDQVVNGLDDTGAYIDDVFVFTATWKGHLDALDKTLGRLVEAGLKCKLSKCSFAGDSVKCLGHTVTSQGVTVDEDKIQAVKDLPVPTDVTGVRSFMGMLNYFRQYIEGFAEISEPLNRLTRKKVEWEWSDECQAAFQRLKDLLCEKPILAMPNFDLGHPTFVLHTDWSKTLVDWT